MCRLAAFLAQGRVEKVAACIRAGKHAATILSGSTPTPYEAGTAAITCAEYALLTPLPFTEVRT
jgi:hypothetical protein